MNRDQAKVFLDENRIRYVLAQFVDIHGSAKAKAVPVEHLEMVTCWLIFGPANTLRQWPFGNRGAYEEGTIY